MDEALQRFRDSGREVIDYITARIADLDGERVRLDGQMQDLDRDISLLRSQRDYVDMALTELQHTLAEQPAPEPEPDPVHEYIEADIARVGLAESGETYLAKALHSEEHTYHKVPDPHHVSLKAWITAKLKANGTVKAKVLAQELRTSGAHNSNQTTQARLADNIGWHLRNLVSSGDAKRIGPGKYAWLDNANH